jgi:hypothetical protein
MGVVWWRNYQVQRKESKLEKRIRLSIYDVFNQHADEQ